MVTSEVGAMAGVRAFLGALFVAALLAPAAPAAAGTTEPLPSCRALFRGSAIPKFPIPPGCRLLQTSWVVGYDDGGLIYLSARGSAKKVIGDLADGLGKLDVSVKHATPRGGKCAPEDVLDLGLKRIPCDALTFKAAGESVRALALSCGKRAQIEISTADARQQLETSSGGGVVAPCLDPKGTGVALKKADAEEMLLDGLCAEPLSIYEQPHLLYAIDQLEVPGLSLDLSAGFNELTSSATCSDLKIEGVLALAPGQKSWRTPPEYADKARSGLGGGSVFLFFRVRSGDIEGWAPYESSTAFLPGQPGREIIEAFPILLPEVSKPGVSDLVLSAEPSLQEGESCSPGSTFSNYWIVSMRNAGAGPTPTDVDIEVTVSGLAPETKSFHWTRGLAPGEAFPFTGTVGDASTLTVGTRIRLDPENTVDESNEANNEQTLGPLEVFSCVPA